MAQRQQSFDRRQAARWAAVAFGHAREPGSGCGSASQREAHVSAGAFRRGLSPASFVRGSRTAHMCGAESNMPAHVGARRSRPRLCALAAEGPTPGQRRPSSRRGADVGRLARQGRGGAEQGRGQGIEAVDTGVGVCTAPLRCRPGGQGSASGRPMPWGSVWGQRRGRCMRGSLHGTLGGGACRRDPRVLVPGGARGAAEQRPRPQSGERRSWQRLQRWKPRSGCADAPAQQGSSHGVGGSRPGPTRAVESAEFAGRRPGRRSVAPRAD